MFSMLILIILVILLVLVIAHEFGHFIVAKKAGIRVDEFAFGFPPRLFAKKFGETTYSFNLLPLGGYVKIYGENPDDVTNADRERSFISKPRHIQAAVIVAGIVFNIILAWLLISSTLMIGINASAEDYAPGEVQNVKLMVTDLAPNAPARIAGLTPGDVLLSVSDGIERVDAIDADAVSGFIGPREGRNITITYVRQGETKEATLVPLQGIVKDRAAIGVYMDMVGTLHLAPHKALWVGAQQTYIYTLKIAEGIYGFIHDAILGRADFDQVTGPVGIVKAVGDAFAIGFSNLLLLTALISINLAIINIIPFPALDGGRLLFIIIESITRRAIPARIANYANIGGFALLMLLMIAVTWHDILVRMHG